MSWPQDLGTNNLAIQLQKLAKDISYHTPATRKLLILEAARRLTEYRERERAGRLR